MTDFADRDLTKLMNFRSVLLDLGDTLSLSQLVGLLSVAVEPGISINDLADRIQVPQQSASRYVAILLGRYQSGLEKEPIIPLIRQEINSDDPRKRALYLTDTGRELVTKIAKYQ